MRALHLGVLVLLASGCQDGSSSFSNPHETENLVEFSFRGLTPGKSTVDDVQKSPRVYECEYKEPSDFCLFKDSMIGNAPVGAGTIHFSKVKVFEPQTSKVVDKVVVDWIHFNIAPNAYDDLLVELTKVYGTPCDTRSKELQNAFGARFHGDETEWCFSQGHMTLRRHSESNLLEGELEFFQYDPTPKAGPTYTSETL